ncbi:MAG: carbohydrate kinase family protein [Acidobacteria bacterium]|nr:MAG: carbohydrate kinase family protein [Acidobacteriota bacterium]
MCRVVDVVVAGHICLDLIPVIPEEAGAAAQLLAPGTLTEVGPPVISTGGVVSNTGLALHRLGIGTRLVAKVGDDLFGRAVLDLLRKRDRFLAGGMIVSPAETTSYTVVISPPNKDRLFLHCPGANNTFEAADITDEQLQGARLFHFGYPPIMRRMWEHHGAELREILQRAKDLGLTTSLDMVKPDPNSDAGRAPWRRLLTNVLRLVDVFLPSFEEILYMLDRPRFDSLVAAAGTESIFSIVDTDLLEQVATILLQMGVAVVGLKLGDSGLYLQTTGDTGRWKEFGSSCPSDLQPWIGRQLLAPCFLVKVAGTTGAGDCTIAGFLAALLKNMGAEEAMTRAVAVGACNVEQADATSGIPPWATVEERIRQGWPRLEPIVKTTPGWTWNSGPGIWVGPKDPQARTNTD